MKEENLWRIFWQIVKGVMHIHSKGVVHRDLKPMNVFVTQKLKFKIGDFSESRKLRFGRVLKVSGRVIGSPFAMSPEIIKK
jgi:serine/threonine protein kinase